MKIIKKVIMYTALATLVLTPIFWIGWKLFITYKIKKGKRYYTAIKNFPKYYVYDTTNQSLNLVYYIETFDLKNKLLEYYDSIDNNYRKKIQFPTKTVVLFKPVFVNQKKELDTNLVLFIDFDTTCFGFIKGYVCKKFLFNGPPTESMILKYKKTFEDLKKNTGYSTKNNISSTKTNSLYGIQCDCK